jgi:hypothetical protein
MTRPDPNERPSPPSGATLARCLRCRLRPVRAPGRKLCAVCAARIWAKAVVKAR